MEISFVHYQNPKIAERVWRQYEPEINFLGVERRAIEILREAVISTELDARLDILLANCRAAASAKSPSSSRIKPIRIESDIDANGAYSNARKVLEESF